MPGTITEHEEDAAPEEQSGDVLVLVLDADRPSTPPARYSLAGVERVLLGRGERAAVRKVIEGRRTLELGVEDRRASTRHARLSRLGGRWVLDDLESKNGTLVNGVATPQIELADGDLIEIGRVFFLFREEVELTDLDAAVTLCPAVAETMAALGEIAPSDVAVLLEGETGTGKEVAARAVHARSGRTGAFVAVNCGALPDTLVETELFGYRKGAFSGATEDRPGLVRSADGGTLFLDEIGDLAPDSQAALLRVLQEREVMPVGASRALAVDLRVISATHHDLAKLAESGKFRKDLYARLRGFRAALVPLRERREDLGLLVWTLLQRRDAARAPSLKLAPRAVRALFFHEWPLNVRELEQCLASALLLCRGDTIGLEHLPEELQRATPPARPAGEAPLDAEDQARRDRLAALLREHQGNVAAVARVMGKARMQVHRWLKRYGLIPDAYR